MWAITNISNQGTQSQLVALFQKTTLTDNVIGEHMPANNYFTNLLMKAFLNGLKSFNDKALIQNLLQSIKNLLDCHSSLSNIDNSNEHTSVFEQFQKFEGNQTIDWLLEKYSISGQDVQPENDQEVLAIFNLSNEIISASQALDMNNQNDLDPHDSNQNDNIENVFQI